MKQTREEPNNLLRRYLLHDLDDIELEQIEMKLLTDKDFSRTLAIAQDDLIDNFIAERLSEYDMERFRKYYLTTPERVQKVKFATALDRYVSEKGQEWTTSPFSRLQMYFRARPLNTAFAAAGLVCVFGIAIFVIARMGLFKQNGFQMEFTRVNRAQPETDSKPLSDLMQSSTNTAALFLKQNLVREDNELRRVEVTRDLTLIRLLLEVPSGSQDNYTVVLQTAAGQDLVSTGDLKARNDNGVQFVVTNIPAKFLTRGDYQLRLIGISSGRATDVGLYPFQVTTK